MFAFRILNPKYAGAWDRFVLSQPNGTFFHLSGWTRAIEAAFGHRTLHYFTERDGQVTGIMPLVWIKTRLFGDTMISMPFRGYGGPLAVDQESADQLEEYAGLLLRESTATALEIRCRDPAPSWDGWVPGPPRYATFRAAIEADHERNMQAIPCAQRAKLRQATRNGLTSVADRDADRFYAVHAESMRNRGVPAFHRRYFRILMEVFGKDADIVTVFDKEKPVASVMNFYFREEVLPYHGGGTAAALGLGANDFLYWEVMRRAADRGCRLFDFGRSRIGTDSFAAKQEWGFQAQPLHDAIRTKPGHPVPEADRPDAGHRLLNKAWKHLPLPVANAIGPRVARGIG
ncbi:MAG TPA: FemAB family XrtA/PEP-CTERM system-associated protein [Rhodopila sp.]|uniref:FemAB family XrtA/PEP-CTERM system-associated protein n=1 Tax=Rhodopila sp. TaxID=2480087 RepID=UPI002BA1073B|nr:FemAB family XrtA/PEP-CTERM system-associated protein [Rhodopila sp.]HVY17546.1 FemAB family XrtA/PEP-CTERM system-associated protein [Rhodopila sp.]